MTWYGLCLRTSLVYMWERLTGSIVGQIVKRTSESHPKHDILPVSLQVDLNHGLNTHSMRSVSTLR